MGGGVSALTSKRPPCGVHTVPHVIGPCLCRSYSAICPELQPVVVHGWGQVPAPTVITTFAATYIQRLAAPMAMRITGITALAIKRLVTS